MKPQDLELHDATLDGMSINYPKRLITLSLSVYLDPVTSSQRVPAEVHFSEVERISEVADLLELGSNRSAGNIVYWHPSLAAGTTNIYLTGGMLAITAKSIKVRINA